MARRSSSEVRAVTETGQSGPAASGGLCWPWNLGTLGERIRELSLEGWGKGLIPSTPRTFGGRERCAKVWRHKEHDFQGKKEKSVSVFV